MDLNKCPDCEGSGRTWGIICTRSGCSDSHMVCFRCKGDGKVPAEMLDWIAQGDKLREDRFTRNLGKREEARRRGMDLVEYSHMEHGKIKPTVEVEQ